MPDVKLGPLWEAAMTHHTDTAKKLLELGADPRILTDALFDAINEWNASGMPEIRIERKAIKHCRYLVSLGADVNGRNPHSSNPWKSYAPILQAAYQCRPNVAKCLIELGADIGATDADGIGLFEIPPDSKKRGMVDKFRRELAEYIDREIMKESAEKVPPEKLLGGNGLPVPGLTLACAMGMLPEIFKGGQWAADLEEAAAYEKVLDAFPEH